MTRNRFNPRGTQPEPGPVGGRRFSLRHGLTVALLAVLVLPIGQELLAAQAATAKTSTPSAAWAVQVEPLEAAEGQIPAEFSLAIYESLIDQVRQTGKFQQVFRSGDRQAAGVPNLLILTTKLEQFTKGNETARAVTTVAGATKITVHVQLATRDSRVLLDRSVHGNVRLFGENLRATHNLAKNIAGILRQTSLPN